MRAPLLFAALLACDGGECPNGTTGNGLVVLTGPTSTGDGPAGSPGGETGMPPGPPDKLCAPISTDPYVVCGVVCVDAFGVSEVVVCSLFGAWECRLYPRVGPIVGEVYPDLPVWCGGDGKNDSETG